MNEQLLLPTDAGQRIESTVPRAETDNRQLTTANMPRITSAAVHSLQFPSHRSLVENLLITFAPRERLLIDAQILEQHRFIIESVIHADYRMVPEKTPLLNAVRHARADSVLVLSHSNSNTALMEIAASGDKLEFSGKLILTLPGNHQFAAIALEYPNVIVVSNRQFSSSNPELYQANRMMGKIRGITGSSSW